MIRRLVDFALQNRLLVLALGVLLFAWGMVSFHRLPVEAYPDVANNYVDIIAQWPGISAEQIEQQVTIPIETTMNGIPGIAHVRSWSIFGLSTVEIVFGEETTDFENRERVQGAACAGLAAERGGAANGHRLEPRRPDLFLHSAQHQPRIRRDESEDALRRGWSRKTSSPCLAWSIPIPLEGRCASTRCASTPTSLSIMG